MEIITGVERHRRWPDKDKLRIVAEAETLGAVFAEVTRGMTFRVAICGAGAGYCLLANWS